ARRAFPDAFADPVRPADRGRAQGIDRRGGSRRPPSGPARRPAPRLVPVSTLRPATVKSLSPLAAPRCLRGGTTRVPGAQVLFERRAWHCAPTSASGWAHARSARPPPPPPPPAGGRLLPGRDRPPPPPRVDRPAARAR